MPSPPLRAVWRRVDARVHLALSPSQLVDPVSSATQAAFENLLMRYNHSLKGVVVAHIGPLKLLGCPTFIDASPFAHVAGRLRLLLFNPPVGSVMVGVINYVGPDHLALRVFRTFHVVLPLHAVRNKFHYDTNRPHQWTRSDHDAAPEDNLTVGRQIRFVVTDTKATREGLFQILASLDDSLCYEPIPPDSLGLLSPPEEVPGQFVSPQQAERHEDIDAPNVDVLNVTKRSSMERAKRLSQRDAEQLLFAGDSSFGDALAPVNPNLIIAKQTQPDTLPTQPLGQQAIGVAAAEPSNITQTPAQHTIFSEDDDGDSPDQMPVEQQEGRVDIEEHESQNAVHTTEHRDGAQTAERERNEETHSAADGENTNVVSPVQARIRQKHELQLVSETPATVQKSQESERSEEKSKDKRRKGKHDRKRKRNKEEKEKHGTPSSKRKKKRRHSDSLLEVHNVEPEVESKGAHLGLTEVKKKKKSKDKEKRKDKEKDKTKRADKEKKKHKSKEKRKRHNYDLSESYRESQQSEANKTQSSSKSMASPQGDGTPEKQRIALDAKEIGDKNAEERNSSENRVISTKYESALEAVNLAPLVSQQSAETKSEPLRDGQVQFRTQVQGRERSVVTMNGDVAVKTQRADTGKDSREGETEVTEGESSKKKTRREEKEDGSFKRSLHEKSERKKKKRKREKSEGDGSERRKKKKSRQKREAEVHTLEGEQHDAERQQETGAISPTKRSTMSALANAISRSLGRKWQAK